MTELYQLLIWFWNAGFVILSVGSMSSRMMCVGLHRPFEMPLISHPAPYASMRMLLNSSSVALSCVMLILPFVEMSSLSCVLCLICVAMARRRAMACLRVAEMMTM